jgi:dipeptidase
MIKTKFKIFSIISIIVFSFSMIPQRVVACTNLLISKGASKEGSVMVSYCADSHTRYGTLVYMPAGKHIPGVLREGKYISGEMVEIREWGKEKYLGRIPQVAYTYNVIGNMNEHQVVIGETTWGGREEFRDTTAILDYGSLIYITLQRARNAREAIRIYTSLAEEYGYASSGESLSFGDKEEVWILEIISKKPNYVEVPGRILNGRYSNVENRNKGVVWVAVRIPDGCISAHANSARITSISFDDPQNCLYSADVVREARGAGLYKGKDKDFSFADTYCPLNESLMSRCERRVWSFFNKYGAEEMAEYIDFVTACNPQHRMPLYVKVKAKLDFNDVSGMMRDHYEGTQFDMRCGVGAGSNELPYRWNPASYKVDGVSITNPRAIATQQTGFWFIGECRGWLPDEIGGLFWFAVDDAATSPLTPVYTSSRGISAHYAIGNGNMITYSPTSMFWLQNRIAQFAYLRYNQIGKEIREIVDAHEKEMIKLVKNTDDAALAMIPKKRLDYLTKFSVREADRLFETWKNLDAYLLVKYIDGNTKVQNEEGTFANNGNCSTIPPKPLSQGYSGEFKQRLKQETSGK